MNKCAAIFSFLPRPRSTGRGRRTTRGSSARRRGTARTAASRRGGRTAGSTTRGARPRRAASARRTASTGMSSRVERPVVPASRPDRVRISPRPCPRGPPLIGRPPRPGRQKKNHSPPPPPPPRARASPTFLADGSLLLASRGGKPGDEAWSDGVSRAPSWRGPYVDRALFFLSFCLSVSLSVCLSFFLSSPYQRARGGILHRAGKSEQQRTVPRARLGRYTQLNMIGNATSPEVWSRRRAVVCVCVCARARARARARTFMCVCAAFRRGPIDRSLSVGGGGGN